MEINAKKGLLRPDILFSTIYEITPAFLLERGIRGVVFDIDNTIAPYEIERPTEKMKAYLLALKESGIQVAFVSNNRNDRTVLFNEELGFPCYCNAKKPFPGKTKQAIRDFKIRPDQAVAIGDQLFTDCLSAHLARMEFFIVPPIRDKRTWFFRLKRRMERPFLKSLKKYPEYARKGENRQ